MDDVEHHYFHQYSGGGAGGSSSGSGSGNGSSGSSSSTYIALCRAALQRILSTTFPTQQPSSNYDHGNTSTNITNTVGGNASTSNSHLVAKGAIRTARPTTTTSATTTTTPDTPSQRSLDSLQSRRVSLLGILHRDLTAKLFLLTAIFRHQHIPDSAFVTHHTGGGGGSGSGAVMNNETVATTTAAG